MNAEDLMDLEASVIGAITRRRAVLDELPEGFTPATFACEPWAKIAASLVKLSSEMPTDVARFDLALVAVDGRLNDTERDLLWRADGNPAPDAPARAERLLDYRLRLNLDAALRSASQALHAGAKTADVISQVAAAVATDTGAAPMGVYWSDSFEKLVEFNERAAQKGSARLRTGFACIDRMLHILPGSVTVIAAAEKHGKTRLARQIARNVASQGKWVLAHSMEMTHVENVALDLADGTARPAERFFGESPLTKEEWDALGPVMTRLAGDPEGKGYIITNDQYGTLDSIALSTERFHRKHGLSLVIVDYIQLVEADAGRNGTRENVVSKVSRGIKRLALRLNVPIIALSQFTKDYAKRGGKEDEPAPRPRSADLRESGAIAQDANAVCFIHNPMMNHPDKDVRNRGPWEFIVDRARMGEGGGVCDLWPDLRHARFLESAPRRAPTDGRWTPGDEP